MAPLALVTKWLHIWPPGGATCIIVKYGLHMTQLTLVTNLVTRWRLLHSFQIWTPDGALVTLALPHYLGLSY